MKLVYFFVGMCLLSFFIALIFAFQAHNKNASPVHTAVLPAQVTQTGNALGAFTESNERTTSHAEPANDPIAFLRTLPEASTYVKLLENTGVRTSLSTVGTYTFFVPTNAAFASSPVGSVANLSAEDQLRLAQYHIVSGMMMSLDSVKAGRINMLSRDVLDVNVFDQSIPQSNTRVVATYKVQNGIIYLIDKVLIPPTRRPFPF